MKKFLAFNWKTIVYIASFGMLLFAIENSIYHFLLPINVRRFWILIPCVLYILSLFFKRFIPQKTSHSFILEFINIFALLAFYSNIVFPALGEWYKTNFSIIGFAIALMVLCATIIIKTGEKADISPISVEDESSQTQNLFNIFYLNTSKAHEIAMLIDNKIIKAIESEHVAENAQKSSVSLGTGSSHIISSESSILSEEVSKQRVFESFDVKQTKSIMLRKIYETISSQEDTISEGKLILIKNVELQQMNVDDTVMILNVLQDSKLKNQTDDNIEINLNKMIDKMLDDFTIDKASVIKSYAHFDQRVSLRTIISKINNPEYISHYAFKPFIHYPLTFKKYTRGERKDKTRELYYSSHQDRCVYQYYSHIIDQKYIERVNIDGISDVAIAYTMRKI